MTSWMIWSSNRPLGPLMNIEWWRWTTAGLTEQSVRGCDDRGRKCAGRDQAVENFEKGRMGEVVLVGACHVEEDEQGIGAVRVVSWRKIDVQVTVHSEDLRKDATIGAVFERVVDDCPAQVSARPIHVVRAKKLSSCRCGRHLPDQDCDDQPRQPVNQGRVP